jgi:hypothetical protein
MFLVRAFQPTNIIAHSQGPWSLWDSSLRSTSLAHSRESHVALFLLSNRIIYTFYFMIYNKNSRD